MDGFDSALEKLLATESMPEKAEEKKKLLSEVRVIIAERAKDKTRIMRLKRDKTHLRKKHKEMKLDLESTQLELKKAEKKLGASSKKVSFLNAKCVSLENDIDALQSKCLMLEDDIQALRDECNLVKKALEHLKATRPKTYKTLKADAQGVWCYYCKEGDEESLKNSPVKREMVDFLMSAVGEHHCSASQALAIFEEAAEVLGIKIAAQPHQNYAAGLFSEGTHFDQ